MAQICQSVGFRASQACALETLSGIAGQYLRAIANSAAASANSGGRTECHLVDIVFALEDLGSIQGFIGAHKLEESHCFISSSVLEEIMEFVFWNNEIPFAQPISKTICPELKETGNEMGLRHVPRWLPEMPVMSGIGIGIAKGNEDNGEENSGGDLVEDGNMLSKIGNEKGKGFELPEKRVKVKFKMGMGGGVSGGGMGNIWGFGIGIGMRNNGVFSRSGNGKRILCQSWSDGAGDEE